MKTYSVIAFYIDIDDIYNRVKTQTKERLDTLVTFLGGTVDPENSDSGQAAYTLLHEQDMIDVLKSALALPAIQNVAVEVYDPEEN